jgi:pimeloyl-ACP methyl ester carboxylesterase
MLCSSFTGALLSAETPTPPPPFLHDDQIRLHVIAAAPNGKPLYPRIRENGTGFVADLDEWHPVDPCTYRTKYLKALVDEINRQPKSKPILIFIHGGNNVPGKSLRRSALLGANPRLTEKYYPIFINWNSEPISTYSEHLFIVRQGQRHTVLGPITSPFYLASDLARALVRAPAVWVKLIDFEFSRHEHRRAVISQESLRYLSSPPNRGKLHLTERSYQEGDRRSQTQVITGDWHNLSLVLKAPAEIILDAIGTGAWNMMLRRSRELFDSPTHFHEQPTVDQKLIKEIVRLADSQKRGQTRGRELNDEIDRYVAQIVAQQKQQGASEPSRHEDTYLVRSVPGAVEMFLQVLEQNLDQGHSITIIGHSMGTIVANEILIRHPSKLPFDNIVYMAAACSVKECEDAVLPYLRQENHLKAQFYNLCLHPIAEATETFLSPEKRNPTIKDYAISTGGLFVPRGSLLIWLDSFFTHPVNLEELRLGRWATAVSSAGIYPSDVSDRIHLTMFPVGLEYLPQKHAQFASSEFPTPFWDPDFWDPKTPWEEKAVAAKKETSSAAAALATPVISPVNASPR